MDTGILYVVINEWIRNPETNEKPYKIGITRKSVDDRYYGLGLKMPGKFKTLFAYEFDDCAKAEQLIHDILIKKRVNGEWFNLNQKELDHIKATCEIMAGKLKTDEVQDGIDDQVNQDPPNAIIFTPGQKAAQTKKRDTLHELFKQKSMDFEIQNCMLVVVDSSRATIQTLRDMSDGDWYKGNAALEAYLSGGKIATAPTPAIKLTPGQKAAQTKKRYALHVPDIDVVAQAEINIDNESYTIKKFANKMIRVFDNGGELLDIEVKSFLRKINKEYNLGIDVERANNTQLLGGKVIVALNNKNRT